MIYNKNTEIPRTDSKVAIMVFKFKTSTLMKNGEINLKIRELQKLRII